MQKLQPIWEDPIDNANRGEGEEAKLDGQQKMSNKNPNEQQNPKRAAKTQTLPLKHGVASFLQKPNETKLQTKSEAESEMEMSEAKRKKERCGWSENEEDRGEMRERIN